MKQSPLTEPRVVVLNRREYDAIRETCWSCRRVAAIGIVLGALLVLGLNEAMAQVVVCSLSDRACNSAAQAKYRTRPIILPRRQQNIEIDMPNGTQITATTDQRGGYYVDKTDLDYWNNMYNRMYLIGE